MPDRPVSPHDPNDAQAGTAWFAGDLRMSERLLIVSILTLLIVMFT